MSATTNKKASATKAAEPSQSPAPAPENFAEKPVPEPDFLMGQEKDAKAQVFTIGVDMEENAEAGQVLAALTFPIRVQLENLMPRRVSFPDLQGLSMGHCAGPKEMSQGKAVISDADRMHRFLTDVQALCELNDYAVGVTLSLLD